MGRKSFLGFTSQWSITGQYTLTLRKPFYNGNSVIKSVNQWFQLQLMRFAGLFIDANSFSVLHLRTLTLMEHPKSTEPVSHAHVWMRLQETFAKEKPRLNKVLSRQHVQTDELDLLLFISTQLAAAQVFPLKHLKWQWWASSAKRKSSGFLSFFSLLFMTRGSSRRFCRIHADSFSGGHCSQAPSLS